MQLTAPLAALSDQLKSTTILMTIESVWNGLEIGAATVAGEPGVESAVGDVSSKCTAPLIATLNPDRRIATDHRERIDGDTDDAARAKPPVGKIGSDSNGASVRIRSNP